MVASKFQDGGFTTLCDVTFLLVQVCVTNVKFLATTANICAFVIKLIKVSMNLVLQMVAKTFKKK